MGHPSNLDQHQVDGDTSVWCRLVASYLVEKKGIRNRKEKVLLGSPGLSRNIEEYQIFIPNLILCQKYIENMKALTVI